MSAACGIEDILAIVSGGSCRFRGSGQGAHAILLAEGVSGEAGERVDVGAIYRGGKLPSCSCRGENVDSVLVWMGERFGAPQLLINGEDESLFSLTIVPAVVEPPTPPGAGRYRCMVVTARGGAHAKRGEHPTQRRGWELPRRASSPTQATCHRMQPGSNANQQDVRPRLSCDLLCRKLAAQGSV
jgi:hypothetical protein